MLINNKEMKMSLKILALLALITQIALLNIQLRKNAITPEEEKKNDTSVVKKEEEKKMEMTHNNTVKEDNAKNVTALPNEASGRLNDHDHNDDHDDDDKDDIDYDDDESDDDYDDKDDHDYSKLKHFDEDKFKKEIDDIKNKAKADRAAGMPSTSKAQNETTNDALVPVNSTIPKEEKDKKEMTH